MMLLYRPLYMPCEEAKFEEMLINFYKRTFLRFSR
jgi:hypothetical protein